MQVGFIGVGNIGLPMAEQIMAAGYSLVVNDVRPEAAGPLLDAGAVWAGTAGEVAETCDLVCTCLPGPVEMEQVTLGEGGLVGSLRPGSIYVDHTTNSPELVKRVHEEVVKRGAAMLDAPVSGGKEGAQTRDLTVLVGGEPEVLERARPVLRRNGEDGDARRPHRIRLRRQGDATTARSSRWSRRWSSA